jgi:hypothetical protein
VVDSATITATTGAHPLGTVDVVVTNPDLQAATLAGGFTYTEPPALTIADIVPATGSAAGGTVVTIDGTGFAAGATVAIGGVAATNVTVASATQILATTGAHAPGVVDIVITNPDTRSVTLAGGFTYAAPTSRKYYLAEGATVWTFDTVLALMNLGSEAAPVTITFLKEDGTTVQATRVVAADSRDTVRVADVPGMQGVSFGTVVDSTAGVPLAVERTVTWDGGHGAHGGAATGELSPTWYFAEGAQGAFATYILVANPGDLAADLTVTFLPEGRAPVVRATRVGAHARATFWAGSVPELQFTSFSTIVESTQPVVAERSLYFGAQRHWDGGTCAMGVTAPSVDWYFAEGASGPVFDMYLLLGNPALQPATVTVTYLLANGATVDRVYVVNAQARRTVWVTGQLAGQGPSIGVGMAIHADRPVLAERAMYWPAPYAEWREGHASAGAPATGTAWAIADAAVGGGTHTQTYLLLANPGDTAAQVRVTYCRENGLTPVVATYTVNPASRLTVWVNGTVPGLADERFGAIAQVQSGPAIVVERSMYWTVDGVWWAGGTNAMGTRLQ